MGITSTASEKSADWVPVWLAERSVVSWRVALNQINDIISSALITIILLVHILYCNHWSLQYTECLYMSGFGFKKQ